MRREQRLRRPADFTAVHRRGRAQSGALLVVRSLPNGLEVSRAGFVVSKRLGGAVVRNRVKRRLRAALDEMNLIPGFDVVVIARPEAATAHYAQLCAALASALGRLNLLPPRQRPTVQVAP